MKGGVNMLETDTLNNNTLLFKEVTASELNGWGSYALGYAAGVGSSAIAAGTIVWLT